MKDPNLLTVMLAMLSMSALPVAAIWPFGSTPVDNPEKSEQLVRVSSQIAQICSQGIAFEAQESNSSVTGFLDQVQVVITDMERSNTVANQNRFCNAAHDAHIAYVAGLNSTCEAEKEALRKELRGVRRARATARSDDCKGYQVEMSWDYLRASEERGAQNLWAGIVHGGAIGVLTLSILILIACWVLGRV